MDINFINPVGGFGRFGIQPRPARPARPAQPVASIMPVPSADPAAVPSFFAPAVSRVTSSPTQAKRPALTRKMKIGLAVAGFALAAGIVWFAVRKRR